MAEKIQLTKKDRLSVAWRHQFLQGSWNYERMQNGGWCYSIIPAIKKLYKDPQDRADALKRHLEFYNTHPYVSAPVMGVTLALEEERANGAEINNQAIQGVKVGMMGPCWGWRSSILVHFKTNLRCFRCFSCFRWKYCWSIIILLCLEYYPYGIYLVYSRIWI